MNIEQLIIKHEGVRLTPYRCQSGKLTIGVGRNIEDNGITEAEAMLLLRNDIDRCVRDLRATLYFFDSLSDTRKDCLVDMCFNLGLPKFLSFKKMIKALADRNYSTAAKEMLDSKWAVQVGSRADELSEMMRTGSPKLP